MKKVISKSSYNLSANFAFALKSTSKVQQDDSVTVITYLYVTKAVESR